MNLKFFNFFLNKKLLLKFKYNNLFIIKFSKINFNFWKFYNNKILNKVYNFKYNFFLNFYLIRFIENIFNKKVYINFFSFFQNKIEYKYKIIFIMWLQRLTFYKKSLGSGFNILETLEIFFIALKIKDIFFLSKWLVKIFNKINFWKFSFFFKFLNYIFRYMFASLFSDLNFKGIKLQLKGKISVAGNARTRKIKFNLGAFSNSNYKNKILYNLSLIKTFTGVQGLKIWLIF